MERIEAWTVTAEIGQDTGGPLFRPFENHRRGYSLQNCVFQLPTGQIPGPAKS